MAKPKKFEFGWTPGSTTVAEAKFWDKYAIVAEYRAKEGDGDNAMAMSETLMKTGVERFKRIPPHIAREYPERCMKYFTPLDRAKLTHTANDNIDNKFDEYKRTGEEILFNKVDFDENNPPEGRRTQHRIQHLLSFMADFAMFDYWWIKYIHKETEDRPLRFFWLAEEQIMNRVPNTRYSKKAKSGKKKKTKAGMLNELLSIAGVVGWGHVLKTKGRRRDPNFGPMTPQGWTERKNLRCLLVFPPERQLAYQPSPEGWTHKDGYWSASPRPIADTRTIRSVATEK